MGKYLYWHEEYYMKYIFPTYCQNQKRSLFDKADDYNVYIQNKISYIYEYVYICMYVNM